jgi:hypothetical protein
MATKATSSCMLYGMPRKDWNWLYTASHSGSDLEPLKALATWETNNIYQLSWLMDPARRR